MTLRTLFEKQVFVRLTEDQSGFVYTTKWALLSKIRGVGLDETGHDVAQASEAFVPSRRDVV
jgi:hypothetical protein